MAIYQAQDDTFDALVASGVSVVDFFSTHCGPCRMLLPRLMQLETMMPFIDLVKVNTDECPELTERFRIAGVPTVYLCKDGKMEEYMGHLELEPLQAAVAKLLYE